jgi:D-3-phosphoglycerate dehydrogenase / 2-oxoglutarate reductase
VDNSAFGDTLPPAPVDVLVVEPVTADALRWLGERYTVECQPALAQRPAACRAAVARARAAILPAAVSLDADLLWQLPHLRAVGRVAAGVENIDLEACSRAGVVVARGLDAGAEAEAEFVVGALLALLRRVPIVDENGLLVGREIGGSVVGLVGVTAATLPLVRLLKAFGARLLGYDPGVHVADPGWDGAGVKAVSLLDLVRGSDSVCVLLHPYSRYDGLFGNRLLRAAKPNQVLVSLAHSTVFDEAALAHALREGPLAAAWLDSLAPGAQDRERPLRHIDTLQITPRVASTTRESLRRSAWSVVQRIDEVLRTEPLPSRLRRAPPGANADPASGPGPA